MIDHDTVQCRCCGTRISSWLLRLRPLRSRTWEWTTCASSLVSIHLALSTRHPTKLTLWQCWCHIWSHLHDHLQRTRFQNLQFRIRHLWNLQWPKKITSLPSSTCRKHLCQGCQRSSSFRYTSCWGSNDARNRLHKCHCWTWPLWEHSHRASSCQSTTSTAPLRWIDAGPSVECWWTSYT